MVCTACPHPSQDAIFRLALSAGCVQTLLKFRMGCHNLPWDLGRRQGVPRLQQVCTLCAGDERHVVFECPGLQDICDGHEGLFGEHAATVIQFMWQNDIRGVAIFMRNASICTMMLANCLISPRWLEKV